MRWGRDCICTGVLRYILNRENRGSSSTNITTVNWVTSSNFNQHMHKKNLFSVFKIHIPVTVNNKQRVLFCGREVFPQTWQVIKYHRTPASLFDPMSLGRLNVWFIVSASCKFTGGLKKKKGTSTVKIYVLLKLHSSVTSKSKTYQLRSFQFPKRKMSTTTHDHLKQTGSYSIPGCQNSGFQVKSKAKASTCLADRPLGDSIDPSEMNVFCLRASKLWERLQPDGVLRILGEALSFLRSKAEWFCFLYLSRENVR